MIALVQTAQAHNSGSANTAAITWGSDTTTGNLIVVWVGNDGQNVTSVTDSQSNTYTKIDSLFNAGNHRNTLDIWYANNITGGITPTVTAHLDSSTDAAIIVREYAGIDTASPLDQHIIAIHTAVNSTLADSGATSATAQADELVIGGTSLFQQSTLVAGSGYGNIIQQNGAGTIVCLGAEDQIVSSIGTQDATFTWTTNRAWIAAVATFKAADTSPPVLVMGYPK